MKLSSRLMPMETGRSHSRNSPPWWKRSAPEHLELYFEALSLKALVIKVIENGCISKRGVGFNHRQTTRLLSKWLYDKVTLHFSLINIKSKYGSWLCLFSIYFIILIKNVYLSFYVHYVNYWFFYECPRKNTIHKNIEEPKADDSPKLKLITCAFSLSNS